MNGLRETLTNRRTRVEVPEVAPEASPALPQQTSRQLGDAFVRGELSAAAFLARTGRRDTPPPRRGVPLHRAPSPLTPTTTLGWFVAMTYGVLAVYLLVNGKRDPGILSAVGALAVAVRPLVVRWQHPDRGPRRPVTGRITRSRARAPRPARRRTPSAASADS
jgi:hypothetical protein